MSCMKPDLQNLPKTKEKQQIYHLEACKLSSFSFSSLTRKKSQSVKLLVYLFWVKLRECRRFHHAPTITITITIYIYKDWSLPASIGTSFCCTSSSGSGALPCDAGSFTLIDSWVASDTSAALAVLTFSGTCWEAITGFSSSVISLFKFGDSALPGDSLCCSPLDATDRVGDGTFGGGQRADSISKLRRQEWH